MNHHQRIREQVLLLAAKQLQWRYNCFQVRGSRSFHIDISIQKYKNLNNAYNHSDLV